MSDIRINLREALHSGLKLALGILAELERRAADLRAMGAEDLSSLSKEINATNRSMAGLIKEGRALEKDSYAYLDKMTPEEKRTTVLEWAASLPDVQQRALLQEVTRIYNEGRREQG